MVVTPILGTLASASRMPPVQMLSCCFLPLPMTASRPDVCLVSLRERLVHQCDRQGGMRARYFKYNLNI